MKIKLDENLPHQLANFLTKLSHDIKTVQEERLTGHADSEIWEAAQSERRFLITQDLDFSDSRKFAPDSHYGILLLRLRSPSRRALFERIAGVFQHENVGEWARCFVVATERKIRVLRPGRKPSPEGGSF